MYVPARGSCLGEGSAVFRVRARYYRGGIGEAGCRRCQEGSEGIEDLEWEVDVS